MKARFARYESRDARRAFGPPSLRRPYRSAPRRESPFAIAFAGVMLAIVAPCMVAAFALAMMPAREASRILAAIIG